MCGSFPTVSILAQKKTPKKRDFAEQERAENSAQGWASRVAGRLAELVVVWFGCALEKEVSKLLEIQQLALLLVCCFSKPSAFRGVFRHSLMEHCSYRCPSPPLFLCVCVWSF